MIIMKYGSMTHDFTGRRIKKKTPSGEVYKKLNPVPHARNRATPNFRRDADVHYASVDIGSPSVCTAPEKKEYTGTLVKGIGTMHKSNAIPIIDEEQMKDLARMRR
jgi:hypothetical protein